MRRAVHMLVVVALLSAAGCAVAAEPGWERQLERLVGTRDGAPVDAAAFVTPRPDADPAVGDGVTFDVRLEDGERARTWRLGLGIVRVETAGPDPLAHLGVGEQDGDRVVRRDAQERVSLRPGRHPGSPCPGNDLHPTASVTRAARLLASRQGRAPSPTVNSGRSPCPRASTPTVSTLPTLPRQLKAPGWSKTRSLFHLLLDRYGPLEKRLARILRDTVESLQVERRRRARRAGEGGGGGEGAGRRARAGEPIRSLNRPPPVPAATSHGFSPLVGCDADMANDWTPFFRALFWYTTKAIGLVMLIYPWTFALTAIGMVSSFWTFLLFAGLVIVPIAIGLFLVRTDVVVHWAIEAGDRLGEPASRSESRP